MPIELPARRRGRRQVLSAALAAGALLPLGSRLALGDATRHAPPLATPAISPRPSRQASPTVAPLSLTEEHRSEFAAFVAGALERLGVVGAAVAVVQGSNVVFLGGFGSRSLGEAAPVTPDTLMMVDSLTKPITSLMAATLVDDGMLAWDFRVRDLLPEFAVADSDLSERLTVADLFCACSGIPRNDPDILFNADQLTPERLIAVAANLRPNAAIGERFQYSNHLYAIGGYAAAAAAGVPGNLRDRYHQAMRQRVLDPIGMTASTFDMKEATGGDDYAIPAAPLLSGELERLSLAGEESFANAVEPAGGLWSTGADMAAFVQTLLGGDVGPDRSPVVSRELLTEMWRSHVAILPDPSLPPALATVRAGYGLGWFVGEFAGTPVVSHDGGISGFISQLTLLPEAGVGVVVLTNGGINARPFATAVPFRLFELLFDRPPEVEDLLTQQVETLANQAAELRATLGTVDQAAVAPFLGSYTNPTLGDATLQLTDGQLIFDAGEVRSALRPRLDNGQVADYLFAAPPLSGLPVSLALQEGDDRQPRLALLIAGAETGNYIFTPT